MRVFCAIVLGKAIFIISRFLKIGGGSAAPGLWALKLYPDLVENLVKSIPTNIIITGTNGKTTTARMLAHFAKNAGLKVIRNHTGSNLERGIASSLIQNSLFYLSGVKLNFDIGIWELDEAAFNTIGPKINPDIIVFLNVFRDQLDRYGEVNTVVNNWAQTLKTVDPETKLLINGDDHSLVKLQDVFKGTILRFGVKDYKITGETKSIKKSPKLDFEAKNIILNGLKSTSFQISIINSQLFITLPLPGVYHIYDFLAAFAAGISIGLNEKLMVDSLKNFSPAFGRVEKLSFGYIFLIKNPTGATQVFETIAPQIKSGDKILMALNDNLADGTDVSWIWDANFEELSIIHCPLSIVCSGTRAYDLAVRLKYAGFDSSRITVESSLRKALQEARRGLIGSLFILPTYTAMLEIQMDLAKSGIKKNYWQEEQ